MFNLSKKGGLNLGDSKTIFNHLVSFVYTGSRERPYNKKGCGPIGLHQRV